MSKVEECNKCTVHCAKSKHCSSHCKLVIESVTGAVTQQERDRGSATSRSAQRCISTEIFQSCQFTPFSMAQFMSRYVAIHQRIFNPVNLHHCPPLIFQSHGTIHVWIYTLHFEIYSPMAQFMSTGYVAFRQWNLFSRVRWLHFAESFNPVAHFLSLSAQHAMVISSPSWAWVHSRSAHAEFKHEFSIFHFTLQSLPLKSLSHCLIYFSSDSET